MSRYTSCLLGAGPRARRHAEAYAHVTRLTPTAVVDLDAERARTFAHEFGLPRHYTDLATMLEKEQPHVLHCVTQPEVRVEPVRLCAEYGVDAIILEKPMAANLADAEAIERLARDTGVKVVVNTQRRYFPSWVAARQVVLEQLGRLRTIHVHTNGAVSCLGSHFLDMVQSLLHDQDPESVWATAAGGEDFHTNHPGPAHLLASLIYPGRVGVKLEHSKSGIGVPGTPNFWFSNGIEVWGEHGHLWWTEAQGWGYQVHGQAEAPVFPTNFSADDPAGQGAFTEAVGAWLDDPETPHGNRLETAIRVYRIVCTAIQSAVTGERLAYEPAELRDCFGELRDQLVAREGDHPERVDWQSCPDTACNP